MDWDTLRDVAVEMTSRAYAPYSGYAVGVAGLVDDGRVVSGCNVENAAYGVALCAECGMVSALHASGGGRLLAVYCVDAAGAPLMPCGRCRQLLWEQGGAGCLVMSTRGPLRMSELLPDAFDDTDLQSGAGSSYTDGQYGTDGQRGAGSGGTDGQSGAGSSNTDGQRDTSGGSGS